jgi:hypothetical protein
MNPFDFINSINNKSKYLFDGETADQSEEGSSFDSVTNSYNAFIVNRGLSHFIDTVLYANEMNVCHRLPAKMQYDFLYHAVRKRSRFEKWNKKQKINDDVSLIMKAYQYNRVRAEEALSLLSEADLALLRSLQNVGGTQK